MGLRPATFLRAVPTILPILLILVSSCAALELSSEERAFLRDKGPIVFVSQTNYPPFEFTDTDQQREGMMLDVVRWLAVEMGFRPLFKDMSFEKAQEAVLAGRADVLTSLFFSEKRAERFAFTKPLFDVPASLFVRTERTDINGLADLHGKTVAMQKGDYAREFLESQGIVCTIVTTDDFSGAINRVLDGTADAVVGDEQIVQYHLSTNRLSAQVRKTGLFLYVGRNCMATSPDKVLLAALLDRGIDEARKTGVLDKIGRKWLGAAYDQTPSPFERYALPVALAATGLLLLGSTVWLWNMQLRTQVRAKTATIARREEALRESERNLRTFFDSMEDLVFVGDMDGRILNTNGSVVAKLGYSREELAGMVFLDLHPPDRREEAAAILAAMVQGSAETCPLPLLAKSGRLLPVETRVWQGHWNGSPCLFGIAKDLSKEQEALQMFNRLFAANPAPMALSSIKHGEGCFLDVNDAFVRVTGYDRGEVIGKSSESLDLFIEPDSHRAAVDVLIDRGRISERELRIRCKDGTLRDGLFSGVVVESQAKRYFLTVMIDQTERKRAEQALRTSEERYRRLFESMLDIYCRIDREGTITRISPSVTRITGFAPEEILGTNIRNVAANPEDSYRILSLLAKQGFVEHFEMAVRAKTGELLWLSCNARMVKEPNGGTVCIEGFARDVTDNRRNANIARQELAFRTSIIDNITDGLCVFHTIAEPPFVRFTIWNDRMTAITGYSMAAINSSGWPSTIDPNTPLSCDADNGADAEAKAGPTAGERIIRHADGEERTVNIATSCLASDQGTVQMLAVVRDITERKQAESERLRLSRELLEAQKLESLGLMAGATAHHFNNMLAAVIGYLDLLDGFVPAETRAGGYLANAMRAARRGAELSHFMLRYTGQGGHGEAVTDFSREVGRMLDTLADDLPAGVGLQRSIASNLPAVSLDVDDLHWIMSNLVANGVEACAETGGTITIEADVDRFDATRLQRTVGTVAPPPGRYVYLRVADNGCGMDRNTRARMFDPFYSTKFVGRGLGLAIVGSIIRTCRGAILVDSAPGDGTTVWLLLPAPVDVPSGVAVNGH